MECCSHQTFPDPTFLPKEAAPFRSLGFHHYPKDELADALPQLVLHRGR